MGDAIAYYVLSEINKLFNYYGDQAKAIEPIEQFLDKMVSTFFLFRWERNPTSGCGWVIYDSRQSDGFYLNWNDIESPMKYDKDEESDT